MFYWYRVVSVLSYVRSDIVWHSFAFVCVRLHLRSFACVKVLIVVPVSSSLEYVRLARIIHRCCKAKQ